MLLVKDILPLFGEERTVRENVDLALSLVGTDIGIGTDIADDLYGDVFVFRILHGDDIGMDILGDFAAILTDTAGAAVCRGTLVSGSGKAGGIGAGAATGDQTGVGKAVARRCGAQDLFCPDLTGDGDGWHSGAPFLQSA